MGIYASAISLLQAVIKQAEGTLKTLQSHPGFGIAVLKVGAIHKNNDGLDAM